MELISGQILKIFCPKMIIPATADNIFGKSFDTVFAFTSQNRFPFPFDNGLKGLQRCLRINQKPFQNPNPSSPNWMGFNPGSEVHTARKPIFFAVSITLRDPNPPARKRNQLVCANFFSIKFFDSSNSWITSWFFISERKEWLTPCD